MPKGEAVTSEGNELLVENLRESSGKNQSKSSEC